jgi:hypothetical protein
MACHIGISAVVWSAFKSIAGTSIDRKIIGREVGYLNSHSGSPT